MNPSDPSLATPTSAVPPHNPLATGDALRPDLIDATVCSSDAGVVSSDLKTSSGVLVALSVSHMLNDTIQSLIPAIYPLLKDSYHLTFGQIGLITFTFQMTASVLQPLVGFYTDRRPKPYSLAIGMGLTLVGLLLLSQATTLSVILVAAALVGLGSSIFHPEASRLAMLAAGSKPGYAQALFQVGGNFGSSLGPLLAAWIVMPRGQASIAWFAFIAVVAMIILARVGSWYRTRIELTGRKPKGAKGTGTQTLSTGKVTLAISILIVLIMSKYFYLVSLTNYYTFYLMDRFHVTAETSQICLFVFLFAVAAGTILGGPIGDKFGRKLVIWFSILGVAPFSLILPHVGFAATIVLSVIIGVVLASAFSAILVFAQELLPGKVGLVAGLFFGFAFGISGIASALLGVLADATSINYVFFLCGFLPLLGAIAMFLPTPPKKY